MPVDVLKLHGGGLDGQGTRASLLSPTSRPDFKEKNGAKLLGIGIWYHVLIIG